MSSCRLIHHHVMLLARISLTLPCHSSLLSIAPGRSSRLHPVSAQNCCRYVLAGRRTLAHTCEGVHRGTLLMSSKTCMISYKYIRFGWLVGWFNSMPTLDGLFNAEVIFFFKKLYGFK